MNIEQIRESALALPHATERQPYGPDVLVFEIGGKQFCLLDLTGKWQFFNVKVDPDYALELRERYRSVRPGFHMNKRHWISVDFDGDVPDTLQRYLLAAGYRIVLAHLPRRLRDALANTVS